MKIDIIFQQRLEKTMKRNHWYVVGQDNMDNVKGIAGPTGFGYVNLSSAHWKGLEEQYLMEELGKTIAHEFCHLMIYSHIGYNEKDDAEEVCAALAGQK